MEADSFSFLLQVAIVSSSFSFSFWLSPRDPARLGRLQQTVIAIERLADRSLDHSPTAAVTTVIRWDPNQT